MNGFNQPSRNTWQQCCISRDELNPPKFWEEKWDGEVKACWDELVSALKTSTEPGPAAAAGAGGAEGLRHLPS